METEHLIILAGILVPMASILAAGLLYLSTRKRDTFDDALDLAAAHKEAWKEATDEVEQLKAELALLRDEIEDLRDSVAEGIRSGEMWRGVAVSAFLDHAQSAGTAPLWWPKTEPCPDVA